VSEPFNGTSVQCRAAPIRDAAGLAAGAVRDKPDDAPPSLNEPRVVARVAALTKGKNPEEHADGN